MIMQPKTLNKYLLNPAVQLEVNCVQETEKNIFSIDKFFLYDAKEFCEENEVSFQELAIISFTNFEVESIISMLDTLNRKINRIMYDNDISFFKKKELDNMTNEEKNKISVMVRMSPENKELMEKKKEQYGFPSNGLFLEFAIRNFDIVEIKNQIQELEEKVEALTSALKK